MMRFLDGFDLMTASDLTTYNKWTTSSGMAVGNSGTHLRFATGSGQYLSRGLTQSFLQKALSTNEATGIFGVAIKISETATPQGIIGLIDGSTVQCFLSLNASRNLIIGRNTTSNVLGTSSYVMPVNQWVYIEWKWKITDTIASGDMEVYADGVSVLSVTSGDSKQTANAYATAFQLGEVYGAGNSGITTYMDDFYWFDLTGSLNNAVKGGVRIQSLLPSGDGNSSQFTGSDGNSVNNSLLVDESTPNGDTDYVQSQTVNQKDLYAFGDTITATNTIHGIGINHVAKRTDTDAREIVAVVRTASTDFDAPATKVLSSGYVNHQTIMEQNPNGPTAWTKTTVDVAEYGLKVAV